MYTSGRITGTDAIYFWNLHNYAKSRNLESTFLSLFENDLAIRQLNRKQSGTTNVDIGPEYRFTIFVYRKTAADRSRNGPSHIITVIVKETES
jgi:hypothetical protein